MPLPPILDSPQSINPQAAPARLLVRRAPEGKHWTRRQQTRLEKNRHSKRIKTFKSCEDNNSNDNNNKVDEYTHLIYTNQVLNHNMVFLFGKGKKNKKTFYCSYSLLLHPRYTLTYNEQMHIHALRDVRLSKLPLTGTLGIWGFGTLLGHLSCFQSTS